MENKIRKPVVISTWNHGFSANQKAWSLLQGGATALDAAEAGVMVTESDPECNTVGYGGWPDMDGNVTLDACIMDHIGRCGSVAFLRNIENAISVARKVMEETPHVMLAGEGAFRFALEQGFPEKDLLIPKARKRWEDWKKESNYETPVNIENHDTIGLLTLDSHGNLSGACTTSGLAFKKYGRVGDSPIIGAGLFVDNEVGAACATGVGEMVMRIVGSHLVVEFMRQGFAPEIACKKAVERLLEKHRHILDKKPMEMKGRRQVGFLALDKKGRYGGYSIQDGFTYNITHEGRNETITSKFAI